MVKSVFEKEIEEAVRFHDEGLERVASSVVIDLESQRITGEGLGVVATVAERGAARKSLKPKYKEEVRAISVSEGGSKSQCNLFVISSI